MAETCDGCNHKPQPLVGSELEKWLAGYSNNNFESYQARDIDPTVADNTLEILASMGAINRGPVIGDPTTPDCTLEAFNKFKPFPPTGGGFENVPCTPGTSLIVSPDGNQTSQRFYFLSEVTGGNTNSVYAGETLRCLLNEIRKGSIYGDSTIIVDMRCDLYNPLVIPQKVTLAGLGINGAGNLVFHELAEGIPAIRFDPGIQHVTIRDIQINGPGRASVSTSFSRRSPAIDFSGADLVYLRGVRVADFFVGIYGCRPGTASINIYVDTCQLSGNNYGVLLQRNAYHWRITNTQITFSSCWGVFALGELDPSERDIEIPPPIGVEEGHANDIFFSGCRVEGNRFGGVRIGGGAHYLFTGCRFENNGNNVDVPVPGRIAIYVRRFGQSWDSNYSFDVYPREVRVVMNVLTDNRLFREQNIVESQMIDDVQSLQSGFNTFTFQNSGQDTFIPLMP